MHGWLLYNIRNIQVGRLLNSDFTLSKFLLLFSLFFLENLSSHTLFEFQSLSEHQLNVGAGTSNIVNNLCLSGVQVCIFITLVLIRNCLSLEIQISNIDSCQFFLLLKVVWEILDNQLFVILSTLNHLLVGLILLNSLSCLLLGLLLLSLFLLFVLQILILLMFLILFLLNQ